MRICMLSVHTCPLAALGGKKTGGMNVYVHDLVVELAACYSWPDVASQLEEVFASLLLEQETVGEVIETSAVGVSLESGAP